MNPQTQPSAPPQPSARTRKIILAVLLVMFVFFGLMLYRHRPVASSIRLDLTGTPGLKVAGKYVVDGVTNEFASALPDTLTVVARDFEYAIFMLEAVGELHGRMVVDNGIYGSSATVNDFSGVKGAYAHTWFSKGGMFTTVSKGGK